jgi:4'-phosphopantetheinyl transferase
MLELAHELLAQQSLPHDPTLGVRARCPDCSLDHGRPTLFGDADAPSRVQVSVAHSGLVTVAAAALDCAVGVDVEHQPSAERLAAITMVASSGAAVGAARGAARADPLLHWLRIEAVVKADGRGLRVDPRDVRVTPSGFGRAIATIDGDDRVYVVDEVDIRPDYRVCIAIPR